MENCLILFASKQEFYIQIAYGEWFPSLNSQSAFVNNLEEHELAKSKAEPDHYVNITQWFWLYYCKSFWPSTDLLV